MAFSIFGMECFNSDRARKRQDKKADTTDAQASVQTTNDEGLLPPSASTSTWGTLNIRDADKEDSQANQSRLKNNNDKTVHWDNPYDAADSKSATSPVNDSDWALGESPVLATATLARRAGPARLVNIGGLLRPPIPKRSARRRRAMAGPQAGKTTAAPGVFVFEGTPEAAEPGAAGTTEQVARRFDFTAPSLPADSQSAQAKTE